MSGGFRSILVLLGLASPPAAQLGIADVVYRAQPVIATYAAQAAGDTYAAQAEAAYRAQPTTPIYRAAAADTTYEVP